MSTRNKEYLELLEHSFNEEKFIKFIIDLLNLDISSLNRNVTEISVTQNQYEKAIKYFKFIANYNDGMNDIGVFIIKLNDTSSTRARYKQRNFVATLLQKYGLDGALVSFFSDKEKTWRLSFVKKELSFTEKGVKESLTSAKRYSYLVGEGESTHTAKEYLLHLLDIDDRKITLSDIEKQFDVEKVTKKFFEEYKKKYLQLKEFLDKNQDFQIEAKNCDFNSEEFAKKLMGQIVFLYFLQKKGWLGVQLIPNELSVNEYNELLSQNDSISQNLIKNYYEYDNEKYLVVRTKLRLLEVQEDIVNLSNIFKGTKYDMPWGTGKKDFIMYIFNRSQKEHKNFFDDYLEYFFYKGLNEKRENHYFPLFNCKIPFLNGGLFEPLNNYRWSSAHFEIKNSLFHNDNEDGILDFLNLYNFTIDEEEPLEKDIAVDPEMLGKIFENLLDVKERSSKGAFYTPREIVHYMCQESLANYLVNKVGIYYDEIIQFIKYGDIISQYDVEVEKDVENLVIGKSVFENLIQIDEALFNVKIADPAVGSGAFPLGMLNEIVKLRNNIQTYIIIKNDFGLLDLEPLYGTKHLETDIYNMKLQTIENSIYAVDIETSAIDITKLRLWLSLVVDYPNDLEPRPLPNLDCKIMQGNSLVDEYQGVPLFSEKLFKNSQRKNAKEVHIQQNIFGDIADIHIQHELQLDEDFVDTNYYIEMLDLQRQYFSVSDNKLKKELKIKIDSIQMGMIEETLKNSPQKLKAFKEESKKRQKPWFIWKLEFYDVFVNNGGFDIVIGNPPYVGEKGKKDLFREVAKTSFGKKYYTGKMDFFYFFFHKAIDIGNSNCEIQFITTNYYITAFGGKVLRTDFKERTNIRKTINFNECKIFESALGQHNMITFLTKNTKENCVATNIVFKGGNVDTKELLSIIEKSNEESFNNENIDIYRVNQKQLYDGEENYIRLTGIGENSSNPYNSLLMKLASSKYKFGNIFDIKQGIVSGADKLTDAHIEKYKNISPLLKKGDGIFILDEIELKKIGLNDYEMSFVHPIYKNSDVNHYSINYPTGKYVLYITKSNKENSIPNIINHLSQFKSILSAKRETIEGKIPWYSLNWPRDEKLFLDNEKIVNPRRSKSNKFALETRHYFEQSDLMLSVIKQEYKNVFQTKYVLALLNSKVYYIWLSNRGKLKGDMLELYGQPLAEIPLVYIPFDKQKEFSDLVDMILNDSSEFNKKKYMDIIDNKIYEMLNLRNDEIKIIESSGK